MTGNQPRNISKKKWILATGGIVIVLIVLVVIGFMTLGGGGEDPMEYTWEEYEALSDEEKAEFAQKFEGREFEVWLESTRPEEAPAMEPMPWEEGGKKPNEYTWAEYEALSGEQQMAFFYWFKSADKFDEWMKRANPQEEEQEAPAVLPWEEGGKKPSEYTWAEYEALSGEQQMAFFYWFKSADKFDEWMSAVNPQDEETEAPAMEPMPWEEGGKKPNEYTWAEYEALSGELQMQFFYWFESIDKFDEWMNKAKGI